MAKVQPSPGNKSPAKKKNRNNKWSVLCILCCQRYPKHESQEHMHSMLHHQELETVLGKNALHECYVCEVTSVGLPEYSQHIATAQHEANLRSMSSKPLYLRDTLTSSTMNYLKTRKNTLNTKKPTWNNKRQTAGQRPAETQQQGKSAQVNAWTNGRIQTNQTGVNHAVVQNKENKVAGVRITFYQTETGEDARNQGFAQDFPQPPHHNQFPVNRQHTQQERQCDTQGSAPADATEKTWCGPGHRDTDYRQYTRKVVFDKGQNECAGSSRPGLDASHCSSNSAPANTSTTSAAPAKDANGPSMKEIRRALGLREPCRAEREARRKNSEAASQTAAPKEPHSGAGTAPGVGAPNAASANPKQTAFNAGRETARHSEATSAVAGGPSNNKNKVRIAHKSGKSQEVKKAGLKPTPSKSLLAPSGAKNKRSSTEICGEVKRKKQDKFIGRPRFGIKLSKPSYNQAGTSQPQDADLPLSEGFHWDSIPYSPSDGHLDLAAPAQDTTDTGSHRETQPDSQMQEPCTAQRGDRSAPTVAAVPIKVEPNQERENRVLGDAKKRQHNGSDDCVKTKRANKGQDQMDQLLAVSLREDELSRSLQDLDKSLVQARIALQAAYTEVQQLLLLRQQFTAEVDSLRTKRIEILQGMQEGYSAASHVAETASTSLPDAAAAAAAPVQPRLSPRPSSSAFLISPGQKSPATMILSTVSQPHSPSAGQIYQFDCSKAAAAAPQVPLNLPVPSFPSDRLPPLLLAPPHVAALKLPLPAAPTLPPPPPAAAAVPTLPTAASTPTNTKSSTRQQAQESKKGLKDCAKTARKAQEAVWMVESDSQEETERNRTKGRRSASGKTVPAGDGKTTAAVVPLSSDGNESDDDSVKMMERSDLVIDLEESEDEDSPDAVSDVPLKKESPQNPESSLELCSASTQTSQQQEDRKVPIKLPVKDEKAPVEYVEDVEPSLGVFQNHAGPVHALQIHGGMLYTCSGDNTARAYCLVTRECKAVFDGHTHKVNCLLVTSLPARLFTGSSDETVCCYSLKSKKCLEKISLPDRVLCLQIAWNTLYIGLANGSVATYDSKTLKQLDAFDCHGPRGVSCLATAQEGARRLLLVGSYDSTISVRDSRNGLLLRSLEGHSKTVLCMKVVNDLVFSGSSDTSVHAHNIHTGELIRIYKGHNHAITSISILGKVMVTSCVDKLVRVYELQSHDRLQVYGGHSDMVMCMSIHKSVIYTGCYDGSIQAVKLNLMENHRCWWHNCSLIFGMAEHLVQHLLGDHTNRNLQMVKCRWRDCSSFFSTQHSVQQELPVHMQRHVENDSKFSHD